MDDIIHLTSFGTCFCICQLHSHDTVVSCQRHIKKPHLSTQIPMSHAANVCIHGRIGLYFQNHGYLKRCQESLPTKPAAMTKPMQCCHSFSWTVDSNSPFKEPSPKMHVHLLATCYDQVPKWSMPSKKRRVIPLFLQLEQATIYKYCWKVYYCWWTKSCTSWYGKYPTVYRVLYIPGGAGFRPSTVALYIYSLRDSTAISIPALPVACSTSAKSYLCYVVKHLLATCCCRISKELM